MPALQRCAGPMRRPRSPSARPTLSPPPWPSSATMTSSTTERGWQPTRAPSTGWAGAIRTTERQRCSMRCLCWRLPILWTRPTPGSARPAKCWSASSRSCRIIRQPLTISSMPMTAGRWRRRRWRRRSVTPSQLPSCRMPSTCRHTPTCCSGVGGTISNPTSSARRPSSSAAFRKTGCMTSTTWSMAICRSATTQRRRSSGISGSRSSAIWWRRNATWACGRGRLRSPPSKRVTRSSAAAGPRQPPCSHGRTGGPSSRRCPTSRVPSGLRAAATRRQRRPTSPG